MSYVITTSDFITSVKNKTMFPTSTAGFSNDNILQVADEEIQATILPLILATREDYYTAFKDYSVDGKEYLIPERAAWMKLQDVVLVDGDGNETSVPRIDPGQKEHASYFGFFLRGNKVVFSQVPTQTVRLYYHIRPSKLIQTSSAAQISSLSDPSVVVSSLPSSISTSTPVDFIKATPGYENLAIDQTISLIASTTLTFSSLPDGVAVGDYVALSGQSPVIQLPHELIPVLSQAVSVKVLEALGDREAMAAAQSKLDEMKQNALRGLEPRVERESQKIINRHSSLRGGWFGSWRGIR